MYNNYKNKGLSGLINLGNTCFINSCFQVISHTYELNELLDNKNILNKLNQIDDSVLLIEWYNLKQLLWSNNCKVSPSRFIDVIQKISKIKNIDIFSNFSQNDIMEFFIFVINCFHNALSRKVNITITGNIKNDTDIIATKCYNMIKEIYTNEYSEIWNMFYGISISIITDKDNNTIINYKPESYSVLSLSIPLNKSDIDIFDCLDLYIEGEIIEGYFNENTNTKQDIKKTIMFWNFPHILIIDIKRYSIFNKNNSFINFPLENLDLSKYVIGYKKENYIYDLYAVCNHSGGINGGHYNVFIKNIDKWYLFDDDKVEVIENTSNIISNQAYCLFFRKKT